MERVSPLSGKFALVTGGSRGIGRGIAVRLAERGAAVAVNFIRDEAAAQQTLRTIQEVGGTGFIVRADVSHPQDVAVMAGRVREEWGKLDIFVNNALGNLLGFLRPPHVLSLEQWDEAFACQSRAFFVLVRELSPLIQEHGRVVALSYWPGSHLGGFQPYFAMGTNKAALEAMCRYYAVTFARRGVTVNAVCAGLTDDSVLNQLPSDAEQAILGWMRSGWTPMGRPGTPADIGGAVAALCGADAAWITGQTIVADGGASLMSPEVATGVPTVLKSPVGSFENGNRLERTASHSTASDVDSYRCLGGRYAPRTRPDSAPQFVCHTGGQFRSATREPTARRQSANAYGPVGVDTYG